MRAPEVSRGCRRVSAGARLAGARDARGPPGPGGVVHTAHASSRGWWHHRPMLSQLRAMPGGIRIFLGYAFLVLGLIGLSLRWVIDQAISAPISGPGIVVMVLLAYTIFTTTLVLQRKEASRVLALGLSTLTLPAVPLALLSAQPLAALILALLAAPAVLRPDAPRGPHLAQRAVGSRPRSRGPALSRGRHRQPSSARWTARVPRAHASVLVGDVRSPRGSPPMASGSLQSRVVAQGGPALDSRPARGIRRDATLRGSIAVPRDVAVAAPSGACRGPPDRSTARDRLPARRHARASASSATRARARRGRRARAGGTTSRSAPPGADHAPAAPDPDPGDRRGPGRRRASASRS